MRTPDCVALSFRPRTYIRYMYGPTSGNCRHQEWHQSTKCCHWSSVFNLAHADQSRLNLLLIFLFSFSLSFFLSWLRTALPYTVIPREYAGAPDEVGAIFLEDNSTLPGGRDSPESSSLTVTRQSVPSAESQYIAEPPFLFLEDNSTLPGGRDSPESSSLTVTRQSVPSAESQSIAEPPVLRDRRRSRYFQSDV